MQIWVLTQIACEIYDRFPFFAANESYVYIVVASLKK